MPPEEECPAVETADNHHRKSWYASHELHSSEQELEKDAERSSRQLEDRRKRCTGGGEYPPRIL